MTCDVIPAITPCVRMEGILQPRIEEVAERQSLLFWPCTEWGPFTRVILDNYIWLIFRCIRNDDLGLLKSCNKEVPPALFALLWI